MVNIELYINNTLVDVDNSIEWNITKNFSDIENPTDIKVDFSKTIEVPTTSNNNKLFGNLFNIDRITIKNTEENTGVFFNPLKKADCKLLLNGSLILEGYAKVTNASLDYYTLNIVGELGKIFNELDKYKFSSNIEDEYTLTYLPAYFFELSTYSIKNALIKYQNPTRNSFIDCFGFYKGFSGHEDNVKETNVLNSYNGTGSTTFVNILTAKYGGASPENYRDILNNNLKNGLYWYEFQNQLKDTTLLPYVYCNKMFECYQKLIEEKTDYKLELDRTFFTFNNPFYYNYVYTLPRLQNLTESNTISIKGISSNNSHFISKIDIDKNISKEFKIDNTNNTLTEVYSIYENTFVDNSIILQNYEVSEQFRISVKVQPKLKIKLKSFMQDVGSGYVNLFNGYINVSVNVPNYGVKNICYFSFWEETTEETTEDEKHFYVDADYYVDITKTALAFYDEKNSEITLTLPKQEVIFTYLEGVKLDNITLNYNGYIYSRTFTTSQHQSFNYNCFVIVPSDKRVSPNNYVYNVYDNISGSITDFSANSEVIVKTNYGTNYSVLNIFNQDFPLQKWILNYTKKFGLVWEIDYINKIIKIISKDTYFKDCEIVSLDKFISNFSVKTTNTPYSKFVFKCKETETCNSIEYKKQTGQEYGTLEVYTQNEIDTEENVIFENEEMNIVTKLSSRNWNRMYNNEDYSYRETSFYLPALFNGKTITEYKSVDPDNRYFFRCENFKNITSFVIKTLITEIEENSFSYLTVNNNTPENICLDISELPKLTPLNEIGKSVWCTWKVPLYDFADLGTSENTMYTFFWKNWIDFITNKKVVNVTAILEDDNIKKLIKIGNNLFIINKLENYNYNTKEGTLELQQITDDLPTFSIDFSGLFVQYETISIPYNLNYEPKEVVFEDYSSKITLNIPTNLFKNFLVEIDNKQYTTTNIIVESGLHELRLTALQGTTSVSFDITFLTDNENKKLTIKNY